MSNDNVVSLHQPARFHDALTALLREQAQQLIQRAVMDEFARFLEVEGSTCPDGRRELVRAGFLPEREILTGLGPVPVKVPKVRDRAGIDQHATRREARGEVFGRRSSRAPRPACRPGRFNGEMTVKCRCSAGDGVSTVKQRRFAGEMTAFCRRFAGAIRLVAVAAKGGARRSIRKPGFERAPIT